MGFKIEKLSSLNRIDSLYYALNHAGYKINNLKFLLRILMLPVLPILKIFNITPELICVISKI